MIRYAVVGAGWISQEAFLPGIAQSGNSVISAIVTGNLAKGRTLADFHGVPRVVPYEAYDALLAEDTVDAVYIALPNSLHADYAIRAARAADVNRVYLYRLMRRHGLKGGPSDGT